MTPAIFRPEQRSGYTLIEIVGAMTAATLLMVTLASTIAISSSLVEPGESEERLERDRLIMDRLNNDLRFATSVDATEKNKLKISRLSEEGAAETVSYEVNDSGLFRINELGNRVLLDAIVPSIGHQVDGYSAPTIAANGRYPLVRDVSFAATSALGASVQSIDVPDGAVAGDLLILTGVCRDSIAITPTTAGWNQIKTTANGDLLVEVFWQVMDASTPRTHSVSFSTLDHACLAMLAVEQANAAAPIGAFDARTGTTTDGVPSTYPVAFDDPATISPSSLSLQIVGTTQDPFPDSTLGAPGFADCLQVVGGENSSDEVSLGIVYRTGEIPLMTSVPRIRQRESCNWITFSLQIDGAGG